MRLKDLNVKATLKHLEQKWSQAVTQAELRLVELGTLRGEWSEKSAVLDSMQCWLAGAEHQLENEINLSSRDENSLRKALEHYEVCDDCASKVYLHLAFAECGPSLKMQTDFYFFGGRDGDWLDLFT